MRTKRSKILTRMPLLVALIAAPVAGYLWHDEGRVGLGLFIFFLILAAVLNSWIVFCVTISAFFSLEYSVGTPYSGNYESRFDHVIVSVIVGTAVGFGIGVLLDGSRSQEPSSDSTEHLYGHTITIDPVKANTDS